MCSLYKLSWRKEHKNSSWGAVNANELHSHISCSCQAWSRWGTWQSPHLPSGRSSSWQPREEIRHSVTPQPPAPLVIFCGAADLSSCVQLLEQAAQGLGRKALHPPSPVRLLQQLGTLCSLLRSCSPQTRHDRGTECVCTPHAVPKQAWDHVDNSISCSQAGGSISLLKLPFSPCWVLAAGRVRCEGHPQDPVGISHPEIVSAEQQLECKKRMVSAPER